MILSPLPNRDDYPISVISHSHTDRWLSLIGQQQFTTFILNKPSGNKGRLS